jgi:hypothetical protein
MNKFLVLFSLSLSLSLSQSLSAIEGPPLNSIVNEDKVIAIDFKKGEATTTIIFTIYDENLKPSEVKELQIPGVSAKFCEPTPIYAPGNSRKLLLISFILTEKITSKTVTTVGVSPDFQILFQYNGGVGARIGMKPDDSFFTSARADYMPGYIGKDAFTSDGGVYYLHNATSYDETSRPLTLKYNSKFNSALYYYKQGNDGVKQIWKMDLEEERILSYRSFAFGNIGILFTSYLEGNVKAKGGETYKARVRMFDGESGNILWNVVLPDKVNAEYFLSELTYDPVSKNTLLALNSIAAEKNVNEQKDGAVRSSFELIKISEAGLVSNESIELNWTASQPSFQHTRIPLLLVRNIALLKNGSFQVAGVFGYWREDLTSTGSKNAVTGETPIGSITTFAYTGMLIMEFGQDLKVVKSKQYPFDPNPTDNQVIHSTAITLADALVGGAVSNNQSCGAQTFWNAATETLVMLQVSPYHPTMGHKQDVYALKIVAGQEIYFKVIGQLEMQNALGDQFYALVLNDARIYFMIEEDKLSQYQTFSER